MNLFDKNRALVPMSGFYEWKKEGSRKIPFRIFLPDADIFFVPALFIAGKDGNVNASLITTVPNNFIKTIHHRMPVIFKIKDGIQFLTEDRESSLQKCLPYSGSMNMERAAL